MSLVDSLLAAIVKLEGDSLVLHTGEKPYVVTSSSSQHAFRGPLAWGQVELSTRVLTGPAVMAILEQLLGREEWRQLDELGAVEHYLPEVGLRPAFKVVAARGGEDIWVEVRPVRPAAAEEPTVETVSEQEVEEPIGEVPRASPSIEVVPDIEQEQPDAAAVAALLASSGLASGRVAQEKEETAAAALLEEAQRRLASVREEADRVTASAREESARLEVLREDAARLEREREQARLAAEAARDEAAQAGATAREEEARIAALREEAARLDAARAEAARAEGLAREEAARVEALREEASHLEAARAEAERAEAAVREEAARLEALRGEAARLEAARAEAERAEAAVREEQTRIASLREEAARLEAARAEVARAEAAAREEETRIAGLREEATRAETAVREQEQRLETLRQETARLEAARAEAERVEASAREEAARIAALRDEAARLETAREEAARVEALALVEAARTEELRREADRLEAARAEAASLEATAREEAARILGLREEASRLEAARDEALRVEAIARAEGARIDGLREEAQRLEASRGEATRLEAAAREEAARVADEMLAQGTVLEAARREIDELRAAIRAEAERLDTARTRVAEVEQARHRAERGEQERMAAIREAERMEQVRLDELRAEATRLEMLRRDRETQLQAEREEAQPIEVARRDSDARLLALVAALRDETRSEPRSPSRAQAPSEQGAPGHAEAPTGEATYTPVVRALPEMRSAGQQEEHPIDRGPELVSAETAATAPAAEVGGPPEKDLEAAPAGDAETVTREPESPRGAEEDSPAGERPQEARPAQVFPLVRGLREQPSAAASTGGAAPDLDRLLRIAAARGASGLYLVSRSHPAVRVDGDMQTLDSEEPLAAADVEAFMLGLVPEPNRDLVKSGATVEWFCEVPEIGRVRCLSFRDHRGPGVIIRMLPARAVSAEQLGLSRGIQALSAQQDGLVLVAGPRASGKSTMLAALVDLINRTRADHVITIERQITFVHQGQRAFVSQREVRGEAHDVLAAVQAALREDPDVLVVEELRSPEVVAAVLESAESGRLVLAGLRAPASAQAVERLTSQVPADRRDEALLGLSTSLRGVVSQALLRKRGGGRVAARELLLNTPAVAAVLAEGKLFQLGAALESGRKLGSVPLNDSLVALIREGIVDAGDAWRKAYDRDGLLTLLKREGIDTSFVERLA